MYRKPTKVSTSPFGPAELYKAVLDIVKDEVDLSTWRQQLEEEGFLVSSSSSDLLTQRPSSSSEGKDDGCATATDTRAGTCTNPCPPGGEDGGDGRENAGTKQSIKDGVVTIGCIGYPNVGKSSVLNALKGKKVVSVSQTPGHTKHLQTIFLTPTVKLCDCPGLVFPSVVPKALQVIAGIFPVAQVREPYSVVQYLAQRINLPAILKIRQPRSSPARRGASDEEHNWSAYDICEAWAIRCGFVTSKAARPDLYRAANNILRLAVAGELRLCFRPPSYSRSIDAVKSDPETLALHSLLKAGTGTGLGRHAEEEEDSDDISEDDEERDNSEDMT